MKRWVMAAAMVVSAGVMAAEEVVVYSARIEDLIKPVFDAYSKETGVSVRFITDKEGPLLTRIKSEGANTDADLLITVDAGNLWQAANEGILQKVESKTLTANVPVHLRDPGQQWFGLSIRARTVFFNPGKVNAADLSTYEDLADAKWRGKLCLRSSKKVYNQSLVAMLIAQHGEAKTEQIVKGWVSNLATEPFPDDTKLLEAIHAGQCAVGIANTYYYGRLVEKTPALNVRLFWPNQQADGVHVNIAGAGLTKHAKHKQAAIKLLEWLSSPAAQSRFAGSNLEYPVNPAVKPDATVAGWGEFKPNLVNVGKAGELQAAAVRLMDRAGYR